MDNFVDLTGQTALVTGGSRGIGEAIVRKLVERGARVVLNYVASEQRANEIRDELGSDKVLPVRADIGVLEQLQSLWHEAVGWQGKIDILVNNTSVRDAIALDVDPASWDRHWDRAFRVNLLATAHLSRAAILHFRETGGGKIVGITARIAVRGDRPEYYHDGAMKGGMNSLLRGIARFHAKENIRTFLVCVGVVQTQQADEMVDTYGSDEMFREIPYGRFGKPEEVADTVAFLVSGRADYATGCTVDLVGASFLH